MKRARTPFAAFLTAAVILSAAMFASCEEGPVGIFASVAGETAVNENMTKAFESASPAWLAQYDGAYWAGVGSLWTRPVSGGSWKPASTASVNDGRAVFALSGAVAGTDPDDKLYVLFGDVEDRKPVGVYAWDGGAWTVVDAAGAPGYAKTGGDEDYTITRLVGLWSANDQLALARRTSAYVAGVFSSESHELLYLNGAAFANAFTATPSDMAMPSAFIFYSGSHILSAGTKLYSGALGSMTETTGGTGQPTDQSWTGLSAFGSGFIASSASGRFYHVDGTTWTASSVFKGSKDKALYLTSPTRVTYGTEEALLLGTRSISRTAGDLAPPGGYLEINATGLDAATVPTIAAAVKPRLICDVINFDTSLAGKSVKSLVSFTEGVGLRVFALSEGAGLWSNKYDGSSWSGWARE